VGNLKIESLWFLKVLGWLAKGVDFFGEVDAHGAPGVMQRPHPTQPDVPN
jgi:hypothetical protein